MFMSPHYVHVPLMHLHSFVAKISVHQDKKGILNEFIKVNIYKVESIIYNRLES